MKAYFCLIIFVLLVLACDNATSSDPTYSVKMSIYSGDTVPFTDSSTVITYLSSIAGMAAEYPSWEYIDTIYNKISSIDDTITITFKHSVFKNVKNNPNNYDIFLFQIFSQFDIDDNGVIDTSDYTQESGVAFRTDNTEFCTHELIYKQPY